MEMLDPAWRETCLPTRAIAALINVGYETPAEVLAAEPKKIIKELRSLRFNCGEKTVAAVEAFLRIALGPTKILEVATDLELIQEIRSRGYIVARPL